MKEIYRTARGVVYNSDIFDALESDEMQQHKGDINLILTSPPFPLNRKKEYDNLQGNEYLDWLSEIAIKLKDYLAPDGSIVLEIGNSWVPGKPVNSTLSLKSLIGFLESGEYHLCQQFIWSNPAKLPSPAQWVNIERIRVKDAFTNIWWMSNSEKPKANNRNVLVEYSNSMKHLLKTQKYNSGKRPSEHVIGEESFLTDNEGAIPPNVITAANTRSNTKYNKYCKQNGYQVHPARMPKEIPEFFIKFLTDPEDLIFDPFAGSNTTGYVAETLNRRWIATEANLDYIFGSKGRFELDV